MPGTEQVKSNQPNAHPDLSFPAIVKHWHNQKKNSLPELCQINLSLLIQKYNEYILFIANDAEQSGFWSQSSTHNVLANYWLTQPELHATHPIIKEYREKTLLLRLFTLNSSISLPEMSAYAFLSEKYCRENTDSHWKMTVDVFNIGANIIATARLLQQAESVSETEKINEIATLYLNINKFITAARKLSGLLNQCKSLKKEVSLDFGTHFFYSLTTLQLEEMSDDELLTICFEELNALETDEFLDYIILEKSNWKRVNNLLKKNKEMLNINQEYREKIKLLEEKCNKIKQCYELISQYKDMLNQEDENEEQLYLQLQNVIKKLSSRLQPIFLEYLEILRTRAKSASSSYTYRSRSSSSVTSDVESSQESLRSSHEDTTTKLPSDDLYSKWITLFKNSLMDLTASSIVEQKIHAYPLLYKLYGKIPYNLKSSFEKKYQDIEERYHFYLILLANGIVENDSSSEEVDAVFEQIKAIRDEALQLRFKETMIQDKYLFNGVALKKPKQLSQALIEDLLSLNTFYQYQIEYNSTNQFGNKYNSSLTRFYQAALRIRLSDLPLHVQKVGLLDKAKEEFNHRHKTRRLLADTLMLIGILFGGAGLVVGLGRKLSGHSFFFNNARTNRQEKLEQGMDDIRPFTRKTRLFL